MVQRLGRDPKLRRLRETTASCAQSFALGEVSLTEANLPRAVPLGFATSGWPKHAQVNLGGQGRTKTPLGLV
jgi:hypothetical protein